MSWRKQRVYKCDICGNEEHARAYEPGRVPWLWEHTGGRPRCVYEPPDNSPGAMARRREWMREHKD